MRQRLPIPIAIVLNNFESGGTEHQMTELICRLDPRLFAVHAVCFGNRGELRPRLEAAGIPAIEFPLRSLRSLDAWRQMWQFAWWCRDEGIQVVHACDFYANVFALPASAFARVPVRFGSRRDVALPERSAAQHRLQRISYQLAHRVVANSDAAAQVLIEEGVPDWKVAEIANGLDLTRFAPRQDAAPGARRKGRVITTVANLRPGKGHDVLLKAAARIVRHVPDVRFRLVGDGALRPGLERLAASLRISAQVEFLGYRDDIPALLRESDIFAFPSLMEASPNAMIEAMATGLPVVATRAGGIPEIIEHCRTGVLVAPGDDRSFASAIMRLIEWPKLARGLGNAARQAAESRFSFDRMVREFQQLYFDELAARTAPEALTWAASSGH